MIDKVSKVSKRIDMVRNMSKSSFKFYYTNELIVSVKLPFGCKPLTVYMKCGKDNRPYSDIIKDIKLALELLVAEVPSSYTQDVMIAWELPGLVGYERMYSDFWR